MRRECSWREVELEGRKVKERREGRERKEVR